MTVFLKIARYDPDYRLNCGSSWCNMTAMQTHQDGNRRAEHVAMTEAFFRRAAELKVALDPRLFWYHTIDLGEGLITPGTFDYRATLSDFGFPDDLTGLSALDVGSATGFFAFELERRGARVTSTEVPALSQWDHFPGESEHAIAAKMRDLLPYHSVLPQEKIALTFKDLSARQLYQILLDDPFWFCHHRLGSQVERVYSTIYELPNLFEPVQKFDLVLIGDILLHTIDPLRALASVAKLCGDTLMLVQDMEVPGGDQPLVLYVGGDTPESDVAQWWRPNFAWIRQVLTRLGFQQVELTGHVRGQLRPGGEPFQKSVVRARRSARQF